MTLRSRLNTVLRKFEREFSTHNRIEVSRSALLHNLKLAHKLSGLAVMPVLKGNAYGHGVEIVAKALKGTKLPYIAVDGYFEALRVRTVTRQPVLVMGAIKPQNIPHLTYDKFAFVVQDRAAIDAFGATGRNIKLHLECNTGMNRYGADAKDVATLTKHILSYPNLTLEGVMSHLADSDGDDQATVDAAVHQFDACVESVLATGAKPTVIHVAQSAGSIKAASKYANVMRLGLALYGINPFPKNHALAKKVADLRPALQLISTITKITHLKKGDKVSYNYTYTAPKAMTIATLPLGYYEGAWTLARGTGQKTGVVKVGQAYTPIVGRVCMNHTMISLEGIKARVGDEVVIYSNNPKDKNAIDAIAANHHLLSYALLTTLSADVRRRLVS